MFEAARFFTIPINIQRYIQGTAIVLANQLIIATLPWGKKLDRSSSSLISKPGLDRVWVNIKIFLLPSHSIE
jgi:hypothetical protein